MTGDGERMGSHSGSLMIDEALIDAVLIEACAA